MARKVKGMVHLAGVTYRIVRVALGTYSVVRISDDRDVGGFSLAPALGFEARGLELDVLREVARLAIHTAKTSYLSFARPDIATIDAGMAAAKTPSMAPGASASVAPASTSAASSRRPSSSLPPAVPPNT